MGDNIGTDGLLTMRGKVGCDGLLDLIKYLQLHRDISKETMIEIGAYKGESTVIFAQYFKKVITIDPFINDYDDKDETCKVGNFELVQSIFNKNIKQYSNIQHIKATSDTAINDLLQTTDVSFIYVDGCHTYDQVKKDLQNYSPLVIKNGFIGGHDYYEQHWPGVRKAVHEIVGIPDCHFIDSSWLKHKKQ